jgi:hypothetical protein
MFQMTFDATHHPAKCVSTDETRPEISSGAWIQEVDGVLSLVSTDRHALAAVPISGDGAKSEMLGTILPRAVLEAAAKVAKKMRLPGVNIRIETSTFVFQDGSTLPRTPVDAVPPDANAYLEAQRAQRGQTVRVALDPRVLQRAASGIGADGEVILEISVDYSTCPILLRGARGNAATGIAMPMLLPR